MAYRVRPGDSWTKIAEKLYGDQRMFERLQRANPHINILHPGDTINVPKKDADPFVGRNPDPGGQSNLYVARRTDPGDAGEDTPSLLGGLLVRPSEEEELLKYGPEGRHMQDFWEENNLREFVNNVRAERGDEPVSPDFQKGQRMFVDTQGNLTPEKTDNPVYFDPDTGQYTLDKTNIPALFDAISSQQVARNRAEARQQKALQDLTLGRVRAIEPEISGTEPDVQSELGRQLQQERLQGAGDYAPAFDQPGAVELPSGQVMSLFEAWNTTRKAEAGLPTPDDVDTDYIRDIITAREKDEWLREHGVWVEGGSQRDDFLFNPAAIGNKFLVTVQLLGLDDTIKGLVGGEVFDPDRDRVPNFLGFSSLWSIAQTLPQFGQAVYHSMLAEVFGRREVAHIDPETGQYLSSEQARRRANDGRTVEEVFVHEMAWQEAEESFDRAAQIIFSEFEDGPVDAIREFVGLPPAGETIQRQEMRQEARLRAEDLTERAHNILGSDFTTRDDIRRAEGMIREAVDLRVEASTIYDPYFAYSWIMHPELEEDFKEGLVAFEVQAGRPPTWYETVALKEHYVNPWSDMMGEVAFGLGVYAPIEKITSPIVQGIFRGFKNIAGVAQEVLEHPRIQASIIARFGRYVSNKAVQSAGEKLFFDAHDATQAAARVTSRTVDVSGQGEDLVTIMDDLGKAVTGDVTAAARVPKTVGAVNFNIFNKLGQMARTAAGSDRRALSRLGKSLLPERWGAVIREARDEVYQKVFQEELTELTTTRAGRELIEAASEPVENAEVLFRQVASQRAAAAADNTNRVLEPFARKFQAMFLEMHRPAEGVDLLDDSALYHFLRFTGKLTGDEAEFMRSRGVRETINAWRKVWGSIMSGWVRLVLPLRTAWTVYNYFDTGFRYLIAGGPIYSDIGSIWNTMYAKAARTGPVPGVTQEAFARSTGQFEQNIAQQLLTGEFKPRFGVFSYLARVATEEEGITKKGIQTAISEIWDESTDPTLVKIMRSVFGGLNSVINVPVKGMTDYGSGFEFTFRLRLVHSEYMKGFHLLDNKAFRESVARLQREGATDNTQTLAQQLWKYAGDNPEKLRGVIDRLRGDDAMGRRVWSLLLPDNLDELMEGIPPTDRDLILRPILDQLEDLINTLHARGEDIKPQHISRFFDDIIEQWDDEFRLRAADTRTHKIRDIPDDITNSVRNLEFPDELPADHPGVLDPPDAQPRLIDEPAVENPVASAQRLADADTLASNRKLMGAYRGAVAGHIAIDVSEDLPDGVRWVIDTTEEGGAQLRMSRELLRGPQEELHEALTEATKRAVWTNDIENITASGLFDSEDDFLAALNRMIDEPAALKEENQEVFEFLADRLEQNFPLRRSLEGLEGGERMAYRDLMFDKDIPEDLIDEFDLDPESLQVSSGKRHMTSEAYRRSAKRNADRTASTMSMVDNWLETARRSTDPDEIALLNTRANYVQRVRGHADRIRSKMIQWMAEVYPGPVLKSGTQRLDAWKLWDEMATAMREDYSRMLADAETFAVRANVDQLRNAEMPSLAATLRRHGFEVEFDGPTKIATVTVPHPEGSRTFRFNHIKHSLVEQFFGKNAGASGLSIQEMFELPYSRQLTDRIGELIDGKAAGVELGEMSEALQRRLPSRLQTELPIEEPVDEQVSAFNELLARRNQIESQIEAGEVTREAVEERLQRLDDGIEQIRQQVPNIDERASELAQIRVEGQEGAERVAREVSIEEQQALDQAAEELYGDRRQIEFLGDEEPFTPKITDDLEFRKLSPTEEVPDDAIEIGGEMYVPMDDIEQSLAIEEFARQLDIIRQGDLEQEVSELLVRPLDEIDDPVVKQAIKDEAQGLLGEMNQFEAENRVSDGVMWRARISTYADWYTEKVSQRIKHVKNPMEFTALALEHIRDGKPVPKKLIWHDGSNRARALQNVVDELREVISERLLSGYQMGRGGTLVPSHPYILKLVNAPEAEIVEAARLYGYDVEALLRTRADAKVTENANELWEAFVRQPRYGSVGIRQEWGEVASSPERFSAFLRDEIREMIGEGYDEFAPEMLDSMRRLLWEVEHFDQVRLNAEGILNFPTSRKQGVRAILPPPMPSTKMPAGYQTWLNQTHNMKARHVALRRFLNAWKKQSLEALEQGDISFAKLNPAEIDALEEWAESAIKAKQDNSYIAMHGSEAAVEEGILDNPHVEALGGRWEGALPRTNRYMLDYTDYYVFDNLMRNINIFWMFGSRSIPMWFQALAEHPQILFMYQRYWRLSQRQAYQAGAVTSRGQVRPSFEGYMKIPGTETWINPTAPLSFRYIIPAGFSYPDDESENLTPMQAVTRRFYEFGRLYGMNFNPQWTAIMYASALLDENRHPRYSLFPQMELIPMWEQRKIMQFARQYTTPNLPETWSPEVGWKDYLIEQEVYRMTLDRMLDEGDPAKRMEIARQATDALGYRELPNGDFRLAPREDNDLWIAARRNVEGKEYSSSTIGYFTGIYGKEWTDADSEFTRIRNEINMLRDMVNSEAGATIFQLDESAQTRYEHYIDKKFETPEGFLERLYGLSRWTVTPSGRQLYGEERRVQIAQRIHEDLTTEAYFDTLMSLREQLEKKLHTLPIGASGEKRQEIFAWYFDERTKVEENPIYDAARRAGSVGYKPPEMILETFQDQFYQMVWETQPNWDRDGGESYEEWQVRVEQWRQELPALARSLANSYQSDIVTRYLRGGDVVGNAIKDFEEAEGRPPTDLAEIADYLNTQPGYEGLNADDVRAMMEQSMVTFENGEVSIPGDRTLNVNRLVEQIVNSFSVEGLDQWERERKTPIDVLNDAWDALYLSEYFNKVNPTTNHFEREMAEREFMEKHPEPPELNELIQWVMNEYPGQFTEEELLQAAVGRDSLTVEERLMADDVPAQLEQNVWDTILAAGPSLDELKSEYNRLGGFADSDFGTWFNSGGSIDGWGGKIEDFKEFHDRLAHAASNLNLESPTRTELVEFAEARRLNDRYREIREHILGQDIMRVMSVYFEADREEKSEMRDTDPRIGEYFDLRDLFAHENPVWAKYHHPDFDPEEFQPGVVEGVGGKKVAPRDDGGAVALGGGRAFGGGSSGGGGGSGGSAETSVFLPVGYRSTLDSRDLLRPGKLGSGRVTRKPYWPPGFDMVASSIALDKIEDLIEDGSPMTNRDIEYLKGVSKRYPEFKSYVDAVEEQNAQLISEGEADFDPLNPEHRRMIRET